VKQSARQTESECILKRDDMSQLNAQILTLLESKRARMTPTSLMQAVRHRNPKLTKTMIHEAVKSLVISGDLIYSHHFGLTQLELSFNRPVKISQRIILSPPNISQENQSDYVIIKINFGASFGRGDHPTTRIALRGLEFILDQDKRSSLYQPISVLDIGTGSGVLAIAALKLGAQSALGLDLDPVACHEARRNVELNGLDQSVAITQLRLEKLKGRRFELIVANLRPPTLSRLASHIKALSAPGAYWIISGFRVSEKVGLMRGFLFRKSAVVWESNDCDWSGLVLKCHDQNHNCLNNVV
jgi:ribosomal protein L11 methyltransferase